MSPWHFQLNFTLSLCLRFSCQFWMFQQRKEKNSVSLSSSPLFFLFVSFAQHYIVLRKKKQKQMPCATGPAEFNMLSSQLSLKKFAQFVNRWNWLNVVYRVLVFSQRQTADSLSVIFTCSDNLQHHGTDSEDSSYVPHWKPALVALLVFTPQTMFNVHHMRRFLWNTAYADDFHLVPERALFCSFTSILVKKYK